jgi:hypothetical protein
VARIGEQFIRRGFLDNAARIHHGDPVAIFGNDAEVVTDEHERHAGFPPDTTDQLENLRLNCRIERRRRFVGDQQVRVSRQRHRDHDALVLAAREFVRVGGEPSLRIGNAD